jgi:hypothetical protein
MSRRTSSRAERVDAQAEEWSEPRTTFERTGAGRGGFDPLRSAADPLPLKHVGRTFERRLKSTERYHREALRYLNQRSCLEDFVNFWR